MAKKDNAQWVELCEYIKNEILMYDSNQKFPKALALKLRGLERGQNIANNKQLQNANYPYEVMLIAFKLNKNKIVNYLSKNTARIKDENHKINIIMKIIEPEINDVYIRWNELNNKKKETIESENYLIERLNHKAVEYKKISNNINYDRLKNLW